MKFSDAARGMRVRLGATLARVEKPPKVEAAGLLGLSMGKMR
ncbi:hypothetical protein [Leisingera sp. M658]|nr:hypothetical protein [Leisingera sp. M658]